MNSDPDKQWTESLETGREDDELLALAARLKRAGAESRPAPSLAFQRQLRRDLLNQYATTPERSAKAWRWIGSASAVGMLAIIVSLMWLSISSSGRPSFGGAAMPEPTATLSAGEKPTVESQPTAVLLSEGTAYLESHSYSAPNGIVPGKMLEFTGRWSIPANTSADAGLMAFVHLRDAAGAILAQSDGPLTAADVKASGASRDGHKLWFFQLPLVLPDSIAPGEYTLVTGLVGASGQRHPVFDQAVGDELVVGPVTVTQRAITDPILTVLAVTPAVGTALTGTQPITLTVRLAYDSVAAPALLEVKINEMSGMNGRGVATAQVTLDDATGEVTLPVVLYPAQELNAPADLGLMLQLRADDGSPPLLIELPAEYRWRYRP